MLIIPEFTLPALSHWQKPRMINHALRLLQAQQQMMGKRGKNILHYTLQKKRQHRHMNHYPKGDRIDYATGAQYFYHCHRENFDREEHGHFHCFMRFKNIPKRIRPAKLTGITNEQQSPMAHLVAISMNLYGEPIRLFTVNRWVSSEIWYDAKHAPDLVNRFKVTLTDDPYWQILDQWITSMLHLFAPQISWLHQARDITMAAHKIKSPDSNPYENTTLEELSEISVNLNQQIQWIMSA